MAKLMTEQCNTSRKRVKSLSFRVGLNVTPALMFDIVVQSGGDEATCRTISNDTSG